MEQTTNIRDGTIPKEAPEQLMDILMVMDMEKKTIGAASVKDGKSKTGFP